MTTFFRWLDNWDEIKELRDERVKLTSRVHGLEQQLDIAMQRNKELLARLLAVQGSGPED